MLFVDIPSLSNSDLLLVERVLKEVRGGKLLALEKLITQEICRRNCEQGIQELIDEVIKFNPHLSPLYDKEIISLCLNHCKTVSLK